jgi:hypothetical protein
MGFKITLTEEDIKNHPNDSQLGAYIREKYNKHTNLTFDKCIVCGEISPYTVHTHIDSRVGFIEGAGQGCFRESCKN